MNPRIAVLLVILLSITVGCSGSKQTDLVQSGHVKVKHSDTPDLLLTPPQVLQTEEIVEFRGEVRRQPHFNGAPAPRGHLHLDLYDASGEWTDQIAVGWQPRAIPLDGSRSATYVIQYYWPAPPGSTVVVSYADDEHFSPLSSVGGQAVGGKLNSSASYGNITPQAGGAPRVGATKTPGTPPRTQQPKTPGVSTGGGKRK